MRYAGRMDDAPARRVANPAAAEVHDPTHYPVSDPTFYPIEHKMGEDSLQRLILELLRPLVERWLRAQGTPSFVGADQFIYWKKFQPTNSVAPDLYVLPGVSPGQRVVSWKVWETGIVPSFAMEVVSSKNWEKDYHEAIPSYRKLGVGELILFDPEPGKNSERIRWQRYRKVGRRGLVQVETSSGDRMRSEALGCFFRCTGKGSGTRLRLATGAAGDELFPTEEEAERAAKEAALARVAELEALLAAKGRKGRR